MTVAAMSARKSRRRMPAKIPPRPAWEQSRARKSALPHNPPFRTTRGGAIMSACQPFATTGGVMKQVATGLLCLTITAAFVGCQRNRDDGRPRMSERQMMNNSKMRAYPEQVQAAFNRDYPTATITDVNVYNDTAGRTMYEVNFVRDGRSDDVVYTSEGVRMTAPSVRSGTGDRDMQTTPPARDPMRTEPAA